MEDERDQAPIERTAAASRVAEAPRGRGQIRDEVLDAAPGLPAPEPNRHGRAHAMTVFSLLRPLLSWPPGGVYLQRLLLRIGRTRHPGTIRELSFIHFARLVILQTFPSHGQPPEDIRQPLLLFDSNYDGTFSQYIDTFADAIPTKMRAFWGTSYGFPGVDPVSPFKRYIKANEFTVDHYYSAYPTATTTMIVNAIELRQRHAEFHRVALTLEDPQQFVREYLTFLTAVQGQL